jgi:hypothetical protein
MKKRTDRLTAFHVDLAINLAASHGVATGAAELFRDRISQELARRTLLQPKHRRRIKYKHYAVIIW